MSPDLALHSKPVLDRVLRDEADFANADYAPHAENLAISPAMFQKYKTPAEVWDWRQLSALLLGDIADRDLLDYGCGMGEESIYFAKLGARVTGIDVSEVGVACLRKRAAFNNLHVTALEMRVDPTTFRDQSFDRIHGLGILHHVGIDAGLREVRRLLRPGGVGVFLEPLGDNRVVEAAKTWLMKNARFLGQFDHVTDHEHNLTWEEVNRAVAPFAEVSLFPYHLLYRLKRLMPHAALDMARRLDHSMLTVAPWLRGLAGGVAIRVRK
jgi:SAM-dependent methyltransferase